MGIWRVSGSTRFQNLAIRSMIVFNSMSCGNKLIGTHKRMGTKLAGKFNGMLVVQSHLFKVVKGMLSVTGPTITQKWYVT
eukprot:1140353-Pelagomonas_calceolata.AAC.2